MSRKCHLLLSATSLAFALVPGLAHAQAAPAPAPAAQDNQADDESDQSGIADIVVTATRQATNMQDTPIAITAVTAEALEERGITNMGDLTSVVPNAQFRRVQGAFGPGVSAFIRGIGSTDTGLGAETRSRSTSTMSITRSCSARTSTCSTSTTLRCCAGRRARCSAATRWRARSTSSPSSRASA